MQSLPAPLTTAQLESILKTLEQMPSAKISRYFGLVTVTATQKTTGKSVEVLRANEINNKWRVRAAPGLISTAFTN